VSLGHEKIFSSSNKETTRCCVGVIHRAALDRRRDQALARLRYSRPKLV